MNSHIYKKQNAPQDIESKIAGRDARAAIIDKRTEAAQLKKLEEEETVSKKAKQLKAIQVAAGHHVHSYEIAQLQTLADSHAAHLPIPKKNTTGLPDNLKAGVENLSGYSMDDVKVHYNSSKPARLNAHAYAQGTEIHVAPSQEKHLPHEAWHVVQQKQGRVKPTIKMGNGVNINDDAGLEKEADYMGRKALNS